MLDISSVLVYAISLLIAICPMWLALRFNLHMLQLNVYKNAEQITWLIENKRKQWLLVLLIVLGIFDCLLPSLALHVFLVLIYLLTWLIFRAMKRIYSAKKPIVFTSRVKRLVATSIILNVIVLALSFVFGFGPGAIAIVVGGQFFIPLLANIINSPIEKAVQNYYINDAKKILKNCPDLIIIGITGSYGKTSMKFYLKELLSSKYRVLATPESYNTPMGIVKTIRSSLKPSTEIFICEMGARYVGEIKEICDIVHPTHGIITSIGPAHLSTFGSLENIQKTKFELADSLASGGLLFLNADSELVTQEAASRDLHPVFYSAKGSDVAEYVCKTEELNDAGCDFSFEDKSIGNLCHYHTKLVGEHNVINLCGALSVARKLGVDLNALKTSIRKIMPVPHRMELKKHGSITIIDDAFNSNPIGSRAAVETLAMFDGVKVLLTPGMVELGEQESAYNEQFGKYAAECCDWIVLVGESRTIPIREGAVSAGFDKEHIKAYNTFDEAYNFASKIEHDGKQLYILFENDLPDNYYTSA